MKFVKVNDNLLINLDNVTYIKRVNDNVMVGIIGDPQPMDLNVPEAIRILKMLPTLQPEGI